MILCQPCKYCFKSGNAQEKYGYILAVRCRAASRFSWVCQCLLDILPRMAFLVPGFEPQEKEGNMHICPKSAGRPSTFAAMNTEQQIRRMRKHLCLFCLPTGRQSCSLSNAALSQAREQCSQARGPGHRLSKVLHHCSQARPGDLATEDKGLACAQNAAGLHGSRQG